MTPRQRKFCDEYLISGKVPEQKKVFVGSEVVLKSNLVMYEHEQYRYMFL